MFVVFLGRVFVSVVERKEDVDLLMFSSRFEFTESEITEIPIYSIRVPQNQRSYSYKDDCVEKLCRMLNNIAEMLKRQALDPDKDIDLVLNDVLVANNRLNNMLKEIKRTKLTENKVERILSTLNMLKDAKLIFEKSLDF
jgi:hypothetical protein